jgi:ArsR family transcriptional regulator
MEDETLYDLADFFKNFGDMTRVKILYSLSQTDMCDMCVGDIAAELGMTQSAISHQLRILKQAKLIKSRREGKLQIYSLADDHVYTILNQGLIHIKE